jgi:hypothetical protein
MLTMTKFLFKIWEIVIINAFYVLYWQRKTACICQGRDHTEPNYPPIQIGSNQNTEADRAYNSPPTSFKGRAHICMEHYFHSIICLYAWWLCVGTTLGSSYLCQHEFFENVAIVRVELGLWRLQPLTVAERSKTWNVFSRADAGTVGSNPI